MELNKKEQAAFNAAEDISDQFFDAETAAEMVAASQRVLATSPLCAEAYVNLVLYGARGPSEALFYWRAAVWAGELALGEAAFVEMGGSFWLYMETRPFIRAKQGLATTLWDLGRHAEAIGHTEDMLKLNPNDNQGVRDMLLSWYIQNGQDKKAVSLRKRYRKDQSAAMTWGEALLAFRAWGPGETSKAALETALASNKHVLNYLTGRRKLPKKSPDIYTMGEDSEAIVYLETALPGWRDTSGAMAWVGEQAAKS